MPRTLSVASILQAQDELMAVKPPIGYTQNAVARRKVVDPKTMRWVPGTSSDCSLITFSIMLVAGLVVSGWRTILLWSGNIVSVLVSTGLYRKIDVRRYKTLPALTAVLREGDALAGPGHVVSVGRGGKKWLSWEHDERGKSTGGKAGWQKGEKTGWRAPYMRSRGWTYVARLIPTAEFLGRILAAYAKGKSWKRPLDLFGMRAPSDVKLWRIFLAEVERYTNGVQPDYAPTVMPEGHAYVVLGGTVAQMRKRLAVALEGLQLNPHSIVVVTGGVVREGKVEGMWMRDFLRANGIADDRIVVETKASSTVGNARYSLPLLIARNITSATLVSFDSHVRRGQILMLAAQLAIETAGTGTHPTGITWTTPLAYPDKHVAASKADAATRQTIAAHTAAVLGLTKQYKAAL